MRTALSPSQLRRSQCWQDCLRRNCAVRNADSIVSVATAPFAMQEGLSPSQLRRSQSEIKINNIMYNKPVKKWKH
jgi:hypothetical protein